MTAADLVKMGKPAPKPSKYHAQRIVVDGIAFASKKEAARYGELRLLEKSGAIRALTCHPRFELFALNEQTVPGDRGAYRGVHVGQFVADFEYMDHTTRVPVHVVEDVKGMATLPLARWKMKHLKAQTGIVVREIR